jgi:hypothetical protein
MTEERGKIVLYFKKENSGGKNEELAKLEDE